MTPAEYIKQIKADKEKLEAEISELVDNFYKTNNIKITNIKCYRIMDCQMVKIDFKNPLENI
jgi:hypothetical protein